MTTRHVHLVRRDDVRHESSGGVLRRRDPNAQEHQMPDNRIYTVFSKGPTMVAGLMEIEAAPSGRLTSIGE
jgi:hypothetical protein